jgi:hypothetical protein
MNKIIYIVILIIIISCSKSSDNISPLDERIFVGDVELNSQDEVNQFGENNYVKITGNFSVKYWGNTNHQTATDIIDLTPLVSLTDIEGDLEISTNRLLNSLQGLNNIENVGGNLRLIHNRLIPDFKGLHKLKTIGNDFDCSRNDNLISFSGFENLISIGGSFIVFDNDNLTSMENLTSINLIEKDIDIQYNNDLRNLKGMGNINEIRNIFIGNNDGLLNVSDLKNITLVKGSLGFGSNGSITTLDGLNNIVSVNGQLKFTSNNNLENLEALSSIVTIEELYVHNNPKIINLKGLNNLNYCNSVIIKWNSNLNDFCALKKSLETNTSLSYEVELNFSNPTIDEIIMNCI